MSRARLSFRDRSHRRAWPTIIMFPGRWFRRSAGWRFALVAIALVAVFLAPSTAGAEEPRFLSGDMPAGGGVVLVVWGGGHVDEVASVADAGGCSATSAWVTTDERLISYVFGGPSFINATFLAATNAGELSPVSPLLLVCRSTSAGPAPAPSPAPALATPRLADYLPASAEIAQYRMAIARRDAGQHEQAAAHFGQVAAGNGALAPVAMMRMAQMLASAGQRAEAVEGFHAALDMPGLPPALQMVTRLDAAGVLRQLNRHAEVSPILVQVTSNAGATGSQVAQGLWLSALSKRQLGDATWTSDALTIVSAYPASGEARSALAALESVAAPVPIMQLARVRYLHRQDAEARMAYGQVATGSGPDAAVAWFYLGALSERAGNRADAIEAYERSIQLDPAGALADDSHWWAAHVLNLEGQRSQAAAHWATLAADFPSSSFAADAAVRAAIAYTHLNQPLAATAVLRTMLDRNTGAVAARAARWLRVLGADAPSPTQFDPRSISAILAAAGDAASDPLPTAARSEWGTSGSANWSTAATWMRSRYGATPAGAIQGANTVRMAFGLAQAGEEAVARTLLHRHISLLSQRPYDLLALSRLASEAGLHDISIAAANPLVSGLTPTQRMQVPRAIDELIYPTAFAAETLAAAQAEGIPPLLLTALVRRESLFHPTAGSPVGARGLAQVMPATGQEIAASLGVPWNPEMLLDPATSLRFGAHYLASRLRGFDGDVWGALAAYNGGAGNASRWFRAQAFPGADWYIETVDFAETRLYLRVVVEDYAWYRYLYAGAPAPTMR